MFAVTGPVTRMPSACRGEATNSIPNRLPSNTTFPSALTSTSQASAGGCNGCEVEVNALGKVVFDGRRYGIEFVASPRHADGILVTGPVTANMKQALLITYEAVAEPKLVIAAGACAISGGLYRSHPEVSDGIEGLLPVDLYIPGCPPHPITMLDGLLRLLGRL